MKIQRAVISGATGAVGMALIQECIQREMEVLVLCREGSCHRKRIPEHPLNPCDLLQYGEDGRAERWMGRQL